MPKLLIVDDEENIREVVKEYAQLNGYAIDEASDGLEAISLVQDRKYDLVILDIMMPGLDGFSACKRIKEITEIPVIMLSARNEEFDKLYGFELGVDDYVTKPFSPKELFARIKVILERNQRSSNSLLKYKGLEVDIAGRVVTIDGSRLELTPKEIDLLIYLMQNKNIALNRSQILKAVWGYDHYGDERTVDTHIKMLRRNLGAYRDVIVTMRGMGYKFEA